jgi:probable rRNA maturation factor
MTAARAVRATAPAVDIIIDSDLWTAEPKAEEIVRHAIAQAAHVVRAPDAELAVALTDDAAIRALNNRWRGLDKATNVLSFPAPAALRGDAPVHLGDIAIAYETMAGEAKNEGKPFGNHLAHLAVHGFLHLLGYDHESEPEAEAMEQQERAILARLGIPDPYSTHETEV